MNPPSVLLDTTFIAALVDPTAAEHEAASLVYRRLVEQYRNEQVLLVATSPSLRSQPREVVRALLAPVAGVHVAQRYRRAATRVSAIDKTDTEFATLLVLLRREKIARIASFDRRFDAIDIVVETRMPATAPSAGSGDQSSAA
jgi:predicted nucleic acid-binding protein